MCFCNNLLGHVIDTNSPFHNTRTDVYMFILHDAKCREMNDQVSVCICVLCLYVDLLLMSTLSSSEQVSELTSM